MLTANKFLVGVYEDEDDLLKGIRNIRSKGVKIHEVYSPYPVHGIDDALGYKRSRLDVVAFLFGISGTITAASTMTWMLGYDWPMNIGGKPNVPPPDLIPISFEFTVLCAALGMVGTFLIASKLGPGSKKLVLDPRSSDDKFILAIDLDRNANKSLEELSELLKDNGASEVSQKEVTQ